MRKLAATILAIGFLVVLGGPARAALTLSQDIGTGDPMDNPAIPGGFTYDEPSDTYFVTGGGSDIWGTADHGHFVYEEVDGDCTITAKVISITGGTHAWAKAGVMFRNTLDAGSINAALIRGRANPFNDQRRVAVDGGSARTDPRPPFGANESLPIWMRLERAGDVFTYSLSKDGFSSWFTYADTPTLTMTGPVYVGLAVTSHDNAETSTGTFQYVDLMLGAATTKYWDQLGDGDWGETVPNSNWLDESMQPTSPPDDNLTHAVIDTDLVTVAADRTARSVTVGATTPAGLLISGSPDPDPGAKLAVTEGVIIDVGSTLTLGNNATLVARGGTIDTLNTGGNATISHGGDFVVTSFNDNATAGTFTKQGGGVFSLDNSSGTAVVAGATTFKVQNGTLTLKGGGTNWTGGASAFILDGGALSIGYGLAPGAANGLSEWYFDGDFGDEQLDPIYAGSGFLAMSPDAQTTLDTNLNFGGAMMYNRSGGVIGAAPYDDFGAVWVGYITVGGTSPLAAGDVSFGTDSDEGSVVWVDGQLVVDNKGLHVVGNPQTGNINLAAGDHEIVIAMYEQNGGELIATRFAPGVVTDYNLMTGNFSPPMIPDYVNPASGAQAGLWTGAAMAYPQVVGTTFTVSGPGSGIQVAAPSTANVSVEMQDGGTLATLPGPAGGYNLSANVATGAQYVGFDPQAPTTYNINANNQSVAIGKAGPSTWVLDADPVTNAQNSTWQVDEGVLQLEGTDPLGGRDVKVVGGELLLGDTAAPLNGAPVELAGGMLTVAGELVEVLNVNWSFFAGGNSDANLSGIDDGAVNGQNGGLFGIPPTSTGVWTGPLDDPAGRGDNYAFMWHGTLNAQLDGVYTFFTQADDHEILWLDANQNGDFQLSPPAPDASEQITENLSTDPAGWNVEKTGTVTLTAGQSYDFAYAYYENTGGEWGWIDWTRPGGIRGRMNPTSLAGVDFTGANAIDWTVTADSTLNARTNETARFSAPLMKAGILTVTAEAGGRVEFEGVNIHSLATSVGLNTLVSTDLGQINANSAAANITFDGTAAIVVDQVPLGVENVSWEVLGGSTTLAVDNATGGRPVKVSGGSLTVSGGAQLGGSAVELAGGSLVAMGPGAPAGAVAQWAFEGDVTDSTGTYNGMVMGSPVPTYVEGIVGQAIDLERENGNFIDLPNGFADFTGGITVAAWINVESFTNWARVVDIGNGAGVDNILLARRGTSNDGRWEFHDTAGGGESKDWNDTWVTGQWQHLVATCDDGPTNAATMRVYLDGVNIATWTDATVPRNVNRTNCYIGESNWDADDFFDGLMDEIYIYDRALSAPEVQRLYGDGAGPGEGDGVLGNMDQVDLTVTASSDLQVVGGESVQFGSLVLANGTLTIGGSSEVLFDHTDIVLAAGATGVGVDLQTETNLGVLDGSDASATFSKTGPVDLILTDADTTRVDNLTFVAAGGRLIGLATPEEKGNPFGAATLQISTAELVLASDTPQRDVVFDNPLIVEGGGTLTAGSGGIGQVGPLTLTLGNATGNDVALNSGTLTARTEDDYSLYVPGTISGPGNMDLVAGTVTTDNRVSIGNLSVSGTLTAAGITAADVDINAGGLISSSGPITANNVNVSGMLELTGSGPQRNVTINPGGTLTLIGSNLDLEGATLTAPEATVIVGFGRTFTYDKALTVGSLEVSGTYARRGTDPGSRDVTVNPGGHLTLDSGAILKLTGLMSGTLTTTDSDITVNDGVLKITNELAANDVTVTAGRVSTTAEMTVNNMEVTGGRVDTDGSHVTVNNSLNLGGNIFTLGQGDPFTAAGSDLLAAADITVHGGTLTVTPPTYFPAESLLAYWTLDDPVDPGHDDSGNGHDLQLRNGTAHDATGGMYGGALVFDGNDDDATDPNGGDYLNGLSGLTVAMWIKADGAAVDRGFWEARDSGDADEWGGRYDSDGGEGDINVFKFGVTTTASGGNANRGADQYESAVNLQTTSWQHVACTWQDGTGFKLYVEGEPDVPTEPMSNTSGTTDMANRFTIGDGCKDYWDGMIDDVYIYGRALDEGEINAVYNHDFAFLPLDVPHVDLDVTATTSIAVEGEYDAVFGNLTLRPGADLTVTGTPAVSFNDVTTGPTATITLIDDLLPVPLKAGLFIRGVVSPGGNDPGLLTVDGVFELGDFAEYACTLAHWNPDTNPDPWNENPPLVVNDKITITGNLEAYLAGTLTLRATSKLRVVGQFEQQWYGDQTRTIMDTVGESTISDWGAFLDVPAAGTHLGHGVFATDQGANGQPVTQTFTTVKVDVFQAADGDGNGDRYLNSDDILAILGANTFGTGLPADWGTGDYNADGICNSDDIQAILATNLWDPFSNLPYAAAVEPGDPGDGVVELMVNPADGMLVISADDVTINSYVIKSSAGIFTGEAADNLGFFVEDTDTRVSGSFAFTLLGQHELGRVIGSEWEILAKDDVDLTFTYTVRGAGGTFEGNLIIIPEPGTVVMLLTGALGLLLLALRRRSA